MSSVSDSLQSPTNSTEQPTEPEYLHDNETVLPVFMKASYFIIGLTGSLGNSFVFGVIYRHRSNFLKTTEKLLRHQTLADLSASLFLVMLALLPPLNPFYQSSYVEPEVVCISSLIKLLALTSLFASIYNLVMITMEQYFEIVHPLLHKAHLLNVKVIPIICFVWLLSLLLRFIHISSSFHSFTGSCLPNSSFPASLTSDVIGIFTIVLSFMFPAVIMIYCLCHMAWAMHKKARRVFPLTGSSETTTYTRAKVNILKTLVLFLAIILVCWLGIFFEYFLYVFEIIDATFFSNWIHQLNISLLFLSCSFNPFIYAVKYKKFKDGCSKLMKRAKNR